MNEDADMRAVVIHRPGPAESMRVERIPRPRAGTGELLVAVDAVGVNPVDASNRDDPEWAGIDAPYVVGYEFAGSVAKTGQPVWGLLPVRGTRWGAYAEFVAVDESLVRERPPTLTAAEAAALPMAGTTSLQVLDRLAVEPGGWLLVHGAAGGVGSAFVQLARARGLRIAGSASPQREAFLRDLGVEVVLDRHSDDVAARAVAAIGGELAAVVDIVGNGLLNSSLGAVAVGGSAASIVELAGDLEAAVDRNITLHGVLVEPRGTDLDRLSDAVARGELRPIVDQVLDLDDAIAAHQRVETGRGQGKVVLQVS